MPSDTASRRLVESEWDSAEKLARFLVANMTVDQKKGLVRGVGWTAYSKDPRYYIGSIPAIPQLGIPSINMQDGPQGFRTSDRRLVGTVTAWPCQLAVGATWDAELARAYGEALGEEFRSKGANVILGPGVNIARVARNGRNAEYLTGEEPLLGARLAAAYVRGVQSRGVAVSVKHFVANAQETNRNTVDARISRRALHEVYYVPFEAAIRAGAASVMCSYNLVNGEHACGDAEVLVDLKVTLGFRGWVMSDWWAVRDAGAHMLVDQEMPGSPAGKYPAYFTDATLANATAAAAGRRVPCDARYGSRLDAMATRIISGMMRAGAFAHPKCTVGCDCEAKMYTSNAVTPAHTALSRRIAAESIILLKNGPDRPALPLGGAGTATSNRSRPLTVAVVGSACSARHRIDTETADWRARDYYVVGGSGRVVAREGDVLSIRQALEAVASLRVVASATDLIADAEAAAVGADAVIACGGASATESIDRETLRLDQHEFLTEVAERFGARRRRERRLYWPSSSSASSSSGAPRPPLIVLAMAPGAILTTPWAADADAVALMLLGGAQTAPAWRRVLLGEANPSGRLPVTLPLSEGDVVPPCAGSPCFHTEGLHVGWRALQGRDVAFAFGHGLSYTDFEYRFAAPHARALGTHACAQVHAVASNNRTAATGGAGGGATAAAAAAAAAAGAPEDDDVPVMHVAVSVRNVGRSAGREVAQLYLAYPGDAGEPPLVLRGFAKTDVLAVGGAETLSFGLTRRDLSVWDDVATPQGRWRVAPGTFGVHVGASSRDLRLSCAFEVV